MKERLIAVCLTCLLLLAVTAHISSAAVVLSAEEMAPLVAGCTGAICENWWCPDGAEEWIKCDGNPCKIKTCGCTQTKENVRRVALSTGGTAEIVPNQDCAGRWDCDCGMSEPWKLKCYTTSDVCHEQDGGQWGGDYDKCVPLS